MQQHMRDLKTNEENRVPRGSLAILSNILRQTGGFRRLIKSAFLDLRFGGKFLGGDIFNGDDQKGYFHTMNTDYRVMDFLFSKIKIQPDDTITDVGCGKGRVFNYLLSKKLKNPMFGIELSESVANFTSARLKKYPQITVLRENVDTMKKIPGTIFYLYNPFGAETLRKFSETVAREWKASNNPKPIQIIYFNPKHPEIFRENQVWEVSDVIDTNSLGYHCGAVLVRTRAK